MKLSIITATYNSERTLRDTMESILSQTFQDFEYIIVDGASKDATLDIIREYEPRFQGRIRYLSEPDKGIYDAMNKGFAMATGDVIGILNSDDFFTSDDVLQTVVDGFAGEYVDAVYADIHYVNTDDLTKCVRYYSSSVFRPWMMRFGMIPAHPSFYCRKAVYDQYGSFDTTYRIAADFEILLRLIFIHRIRIRYVKKDFVTMRLGGASTTGYGSWSLIMKEHLQIMKQHGVVTNRFLLSLRYIYKLFEFL
ncbi:MAG: glycosyltransferase [Prevotella sp.]|nr:glycosyltransferase [Prevotella sp.]